MGVLEFLVRTALLAGGLVSLRFAESRYGAWTREIGSTFHLQLGDWAPWVGLVALTGFGFGLAAWMPWGRMRFRLSRALLVGVVPLVLLAHFAFLFGLILPHVWRPGFLMRSYFWDDVGPLFALAVLLGVAVASAFAPRKERT